MTRKRTVGTLAALGGFAAAVALLSGLPAANADELSDLRVNQELLQRRLDQLAQAPRIQAPGGVYGPGGAGPTTVQMMGGSFPRSFLIPGTDTSIRVGGEARMNVLYWLNGSPALGNSHQTNPGNTGTVNVAALSDSGAARSRTDNVLHMSPAQSKISVETRTPTAWGEARTFIEFDFSNTTNVGTRPFAIADNLALRMRFAYATLGGFLAGQANSNFADPDASVETISFGGLVGSPGHARVPQVRYTIPLAGYGWPGAFSIAAEAPETEAWGPTLGMCGAYGGTTCPGGAANILKSSSPDITAAWYIPQPWGHVDFSAVLRPTLKIEDGTGAIDKTFTGFGLNFSGDVKPRWFGWNRDFITWQVIYGKAMGGYASAGSGNSNISIVSNFGLAAGNLAGLPPVTAANAIFKPTTTFGGNIGYRHEWLPNLRSNIGVGLHHEDINTMRGAVCSGGTTAAQRTARRVGTAGCNLNEELMTANANLIWSPVPFVDVAAEYFWGHRFTTGGQRGDENVLLSRFRVRF
jgi:hypothetical protein